MVGHSKFTFLAAGAASFALVLAAMAQHACREDLSCTAQKCVCWWLTHEQCDAEFANYWKCSDAHPNGRDLGRPRAAASQPSRNSLLVPCGSVMTLHPDPTLNLKCFWVAAQGGNPAYCECPTPIGEFVTGELDCHGEAGLKQCPPPQ